MTTPAPTGTHPTDPPSRDDDGTTRCPVCHRSFTPTGRQTYCSTTCRKTAFRRRHQQGAAAVTAPAARPRRDYTVYECPDCGERLLGQQRCEACHTFARRIGIGGPCPNCDAPIAITDLIDQDATTTQHPAARL